MQRYAFLAYGIACHALFLLVYVYMAGFVGNIAVPKSIDSPAEGPVSVAVLIDILLILAFTVPHSVMARPGFKRWWTQYVPKPIERSTYVLVSCLLIMLLMWQWRPIGFIIWNVENHIARWVLHSLFAIGWLMVPLVSMLINHFDLFGSRQVWLHFRQKPYAHLPFRTPVVYKWIRHPLYVGWMIAFWATPTMTVAHLGFASLSTLYMLIAIPFEERDLVQFHGDDYEHYRQRVPALVPRFSGAATPAADPDVETTP